MAKQARASLAAIFDDEPEETIAEPVPEATRKPVDAVEVGEGTQPTRAPRNRISGQSRAISAEPAPAPTAKDKRGGKKPVLIHIPGDMHRTLRQLSVEEGGEPLTVVVERALREYLAKKGHTQWLKGTK